MLNRQAQVKAFIAQFEAAAVPVRKALAGKTLDLVTVFAGGQGFAVIAPTQEPNGAFLSYLGLVLPSSFPGAPHSLISTNFSMEQAEVLTAQYLASTCSRNASLSECSSFLTSPLVTQLPAVKASRVINPAGNTFGTQGSITAGAQGELAVLRGIVKAFTKTS